MIGYTLTEKGWNKLCDLLQRNLDVFAWKPVDITDVPRHIAEHRLNIREGCPPVRQKKRGQAADRNQAIQEEVKKLVDVGIIKEDMQNLNRKLASLNMFLAKSAEKSLPFFKTLKKCTKKSDFHWTEEAESAFKQIKQLIAELPTVTAPKEREELVVYLEAAKEAVSAVLMTEREAKQMPIYFVSRALRGPEINYTSMEKLVLALVYASKRLILANPEGAEFTYALRLRFKATNNEVEYEALITGLRITEEMGVRNLRANVDSRLVANQVNGTYTAKEADMI
ncbi:reverse transcriptase domain-containing protein [Tanacetum coccineum]